MVNVIYIDTLFAFNFAINFLIIQAVKRIIKENTKIYRLVLSGAFGAFFAVFLFIYDDLKAASIIKLLGILICVLIAFGYGNAVKFAKTTMVFFAINFAVGGGIYVLYFMFGGNEFRLKNGVPYIDISAHFFIIAFILVYVVIETSYKIFTTGRGITKIIAKVTILYRGKEYQGKGLVDTGSNLFEPISGRSAIVVERNILGNDAPSGEAVEQGIGIRIIPYTTIHEKGFLIGVKSESIKIETEGGEIIHKGVYLAITDHKLSSDSSFNIILCHNMLSAIGGFQGHATKNRSDTHQSEIQNFNTPR